MSTKSFKRINDKDAAVNLYKNIGKKPEETTSAEATPEEKKKDYTLTFDDETGNLFAFGKGSAVYAVSELKTKSEFEDYFFNTFSQLFGDLSRVEFVPIVANNKIVNAIVNLYFKFIPDSVWDEHNCNGVRALLNRGLEIKKTSSAAEKFLAAQKVVSISTMDATRYVKWSEEASGYLEKYLHFNKVPEKAKDRTLNKENSSIDIMRAVSYMNGTENDNISGKIMLSFAKLCDLIFCKPEEYGKYIFDLELTSTSNFGNDCLFEIKKVSKRKITEYRKKGIELY